MCNPWEIRGYSWSHFQTKPSEIHDSMHKSMARDISCTLEGDCSNHASTTGVQARTHGPATGVCLAADTHNLLHLSYHNINPTLTKSPSPIQRAAKLLTTGPGLPPHQQQRCCGPCSATNSASVSGWEISYRSWQHNQAIIPVDQPSFWTAATNTQISWKKA